MSRGRVSRLTLTGTPDTSRKARVSRLGITGSSNSFKARISRLTIIGAIPPSRARISRLSLTGGVLGLLLANAGGGREVEPLTAFTLDGTGSTGYSTASWVQVAGPAVTLVGVGAVVTGRTPATYDGVDLVFELTVSDGVLSDTDQATLSVFAQQFWRVSAGVIVPRIDVWHL